MKLKEDLKESGMLDRGNSGGDETIYEGRKKTGV